jgi:D-sedoheptulose 7-phosphate isomerase
MCIQEMTMAGVVADYFAELAGLGAAASVTMAEGRAADISDFVAWTIAAARRAHAAGKKLMFVGNGGSAAVASHMAQDYSKSGGMRSLAFNDASALTAFGNDLGYENVFAKHVEIHGAAGDLLIAISSSGRSPNILNAVAAARQLGCGVVTLSGFEPDNPLRRLGDYNLYVPSSSYGFVEIAHLAVCHCILDTAMGWGAAASDSRMNAA